MNASLQALKVLVTGASSGIGRATALAFAQAGYQVALVGRSASKLEAVVVEAAAFGGVAKPFVIDLGLLDQIQPQMAAIASEFGPIEILVNCAGMGYTNLLRETSLEDWQQVLDLNLTSIFQTTLAILPQMRDRGQGTIINVASIAAHNAFPEWGAYCVSKAALVAFGKVLAMEERSYGIRVMTISPGSVNTPIWDTDSVKADFDRSMMLSPEVVAQSILQAALFPQSVVIEEMTILSNAGIL